MAAASTKGALANVEINLDSITDAEYVASVRERVTTLRQRVGDASRTSSA
jgi:formiminotetrahydrofolate cyclodeaminase